MNKIETEKQTVEMMIRLYCQKHEGHDNLCDDCRTLLEYAHERLSRCTFGEGKSSCKKCPIHCYNPQMRERIRAVMRWSGPRMIIYHPISLLRHLIG